MTSPSQPRIGPSGRAGAFVTNAVRRSKLSRATILAGVGVLATAIAGCRGGAAPNVEHARHAEIVCAPAADPRPFVFSWHDRAAFETRAARDTVFVRYDGCTLVVLDQCADPSIAGARGAYALPIDVSAATEETLELRDAHTLAARFPLLGASDVHPPLGSVLSFRPVVVAVFENTRSSIDRTVLGDDPRCAGATHYVYAYDVGAFELGIRESARASERVVARGGDPSACATKSAGCRVPIRLSLRQLMRSP